MFNRLPAWLRQHVAALRLLIVFTVVLGIGYPLVDHRRSPRSPACSTAPTAH